MLLRHLEGTFDEQDISFKGMYSILWKIEEFSKISDSTYSFSSDGTM
jgi:hypothetical protein